MERGEAAADQHAAVGLDAERVDAVAGEFADVEVVGGVDSAVGVQSGDVLADGEGGFRTGLEGRERAADEELAVGLDGEREDVVVGVGIEGGVDRAVGVDAGDAVARRQLGGARRSHAGERAADDDLGIRLHGDGGDLRVGIRIERGVDRAVGVEAGEKVAARRGGGRVGRNARGERTEHATNQNLAVGLHGDRGDRGVRRRIKRGVEGTVGVEPEEIRTARRGGGAGRNHGGERAAHENATVALQRDDAHLAVEVREELGVNGARRVQAREAFAALAADGGERAADDHFAVGLEGEGVDAAVEVGRVGRVDRAVGIEARDVVVRGAADIGERARDHDPAVGLRHGSEDAAPRVEFEVGVDRAVGIQPGEVIADDGGGGTARDGAGEVAADDDLAVGLGGESPHLGVHDGSEDVVD